MTHVELATWECFSITHQGKVNEVVYLLEMFWSSVALHQKSSSLWLFVFVPFLTAFIIVDPLN